MDSFIDGLTTVFKKVTDFVQTPGGSMVLTFAAGMFAPDDLDRDQASDERKYEREDQLDREKQDRYKAVGNIDLGVKRKEPSAARQFSAGGGDPLDPMGIINQNVEGQRRREEARKPKEEGLIY
jgi:hypothetical protein